MKNGKLKCCIITGSRAEYGLFLPLLKRITKEARMELQLIATGMHLSPEFGLTYQQIEDDGFVIDAKIEMLLSADSAAAITKSTGLGLIGFADAFERLKPHWVILLGDRFETFAAATAAHIAKIPIAHLHGGEITEGAVDDAFRHAISKMAYLHFTSTETYRKRVIQLGESPERVFNVGAIGVDNLSTVKLLSLPALKKELKFDIDSKNTVLVTFHPVTLENNSSKRQMNNLLRALEHFPYLKIIFTLPNADGDGRVITNLIQQFVEKHPLSSKSFTSLGTIRYLSLLKIVKAVIGNSSSGIIEAPYFYIPAVNIGDRQKGRIKPSTVIDTSPETKDIVKAIQKAVSPGFLKTCKQRISQYGNGNTSKQIVQHLLEKGIIKTTKKSFFDISC
ncbi:MAG: UDP-N-acetylglucosamine 2-epimerase (hydrolyzing) [Chitinophagaceae bacterium]|nr:UDP-N-acetylglucosamine 2-epimerase (hydrolyzing) [Chitinophagaceae bacterium]